MYTKQNKLLNCYVMISVSSENTKNEREFVVKTAYAINAKSNPFTRISFLQ